VHQRFSRQLCRSLSHGPRQQTDSCLGSDFSHQAVELAIEEGAAVKHSSGFRKKKIRFSQLQFLDDLARLISQILRPGRQERSRRGVARSGARSEEHTSELQSRFDLVCRLLLEQTKPSQTVDHWLV